MNINITKTGNNVVVNINGVNTIIEFNEVIYSDLINTEALLEECKTREEAEVLIAKAEQLVEEATSKAWDKDNQFDVLIPNLLVEGVKDGAIYLISQGVRVDIALPKVLAEKVKDLIYAEGDFKPIIKAWTRFLRNPYLSEEKAINFGNYITSEYVDSDVYEKYINEDCTEERARELATFPGVSITKEGFLCCYKYVALHTNKYDTETGELVDRYKYTYDEETGEKMIDSSLCAEDLYFVPSVMGFSGDEFAADGVLGHRVVVGATHELASWDMVDCDDSSYCCPGLHLGGRAYVTNFGGATRWLLECFVDPSQIGAFDNSGNGAIRCKSYYVHNIKSTPIRGFYHSSTYAAITDSKWEIERAAAIEEANNLIKLIENKKRVLNAI